MLTAPALLASTATALKNGTVDLLDYIDEVCQKIETVEAEVYALVPEADRRGRLFSEATELQARFPDPDARPPLYGVLLGVKDIFSSEGFATRAGSLLPAELFAGPEAACVTSLREAGALVVGKTISAEFAYAEPGPTRNPHNVRHTPGGSSSGSAAAVAAGFCPVALGTQTSGSVIRPAAFCGIFGFKPSYGRIPTAGLVPCAPSLDTVGYFTQDIAGIALVAPLLCGEWQNSEISEISEAPVLGVPDGPYLAKAGPEALQAFDTQLARLEEAGYTVRHVPVMHNFGTIYHQHMRLVFAEMALQHRTWFAEFENLYRPDTVSAIRAGQLVSAEELAAARAGRNKLRRTLEAAMAQNGIDLWVCPAATGPAPDEISTTGDPIMNLPWTYAGMPAITIPVGFASNGLPLGLQVIGTFMADEKLVAWTQSLNQLF